MSIEYAIVRTKFDTMRFADCRYAGNLVCHRVVDESSHQLDTNRIMPDRPNYFSGSGGWVEQVSTQPPDPKFFSPIRQRLTPDRQRRLPFLHFL
jgi:hypothetical protein